MFSAARCSLPLHPQPHTGTIPCRRPSHRARAPTAVSAAPRRRGTRGPRRGSSWDDGSDSDADDRIDADFFGQDQDDDEEEEEPSPPTRAASTEPQLRGTDVLRALQRAAAAKEAKKKKDKKPAAVRQRQGKEKVEGGGEVAVAGGEVRPVVVKSQWAARIRELELRVQQLADKYHQ